MKPINAIPYWHQGNYIKTVSDLQVFDQDTDLVARLPASFELETIGFLPMPDGHIFNHEPCFNFDVMIYNRIVDRVEATRRLRDWVKAKIEAGERITSRERKKAKQDIYEKMIAAAPIHERKITVAMKQQNVYVLTSSESAAEKVLEWLRRVLGTLPVVPVADHQPPWFRFYLHSILTGTIDNLSFDVGSNCVLSDGAGGSISIRKRYLFTDEINELLRSGMIVHRLTLLNVNQMGEPSSSFELDRNHHLYQLRLDVEAAEPSHINTVDGWQSWAADRWLTLREVLDIYAKLTFDLMEGEGHCRQLAGVEEEQAEA